MATENLTFEINATGSDEVDKLVLSLQNLDNVLDKLDVGKFNSISKSLESLSGFEGVKGIDKVVEELNKLGTLKLDNLDSLIGLESVANSLQKLNGVKINNSIINFLTDLSLVSDFAIPNVNDLERLSFALSNLNKVTINKSLPKSLEEILNIANSFVGIDVSGIEQIGRGLSYLSGLNIRIDRNIGTALTSIITAINTMGETANIQGITDVINALKTLDGIKVGTKLGTALESIVTAVNSLSEDVNIGGITDIANALQSLDRIRIGRTIGDSVYNIITALNELSTVRPINPQISANIEQLGNAFLSFSGLEGIQFSGISRLTETLTQIGNIRPIGNEIFENVDRIADAIIRLNSRLSGIDDRRLSRLASIIRSLSPRIDSAENSTNRLSRSMSRLNSLSLLSIDVILRWGKTLFSAISKTVSSSASMYKNLEFFNKAMGESAVEAENFAKRVEAAMGIPAAEFMDMQVGIQALVRGFGVASKSATIMSQNMVQLAYDMSTIRKESPEQILNSLRSGLLESSESVRKLGIDVSNFRLQQELLNLYLKTGNEQYNVNIATLSQASKAQLRYNAMIADSVLYQGEFGRSLENPAIQLQILRGQFQMLKNELGVLLIPIVNKIIPPIIAAIQILREFAVSLASIFGFTFPKMDTKDYGAMVEYADDTESALSGAGTAAKELKAYLAGFDTLNVMEIPSAGGGGAAVGGTTLDIPLSEYDFFTGEIAKKIEEWKNKLAPFKKALDKVAEIIGWIYDKFGLIGVIVVAIGAALLAWTIGKGILNAISNLVSEFLKLHGMKVIGITLMIGGALIAISALKDALRNGLDAENIGWMIGGDLIGGIGAFITAKAFGVGTSAALLLAAGFTAGLVGFQIGVLSIQNMIENGVSWTNVGGGIASAVLGGLASFLALKGLATIAPKLATILIELVGASSAVGAGASIGIVLLSGWAAFMVTTNIMQATGFDKKMEEMGAYIYESGGKSGNVYLDGFAKVIEGGARTLSFLGILEPIDAEIDTSMDYLVETFNATTEHLGKAARDSTLTQTEYIEAMKDNWMAYDSTISESKAYEYATQNSKKYFEEVKLGIDETSDVLENSISQADLEILNMIKGFENAREQLVSMNLPVDDINNQIAEWRGKLEDASLTTEDLTNQFDDAYNSANNISQSWVDTSELMKQTPEGLAELQTALENAGIAAGNMSIEVTNAFLAINETFGTLTEMPSAIQKSMSEVSTVMSTETSTINSIVKLWSETMIANFSTTTDSLKLSVSTAFTEISLNFNTQLTDISTKTKTKLTEVSNEFNAKFMLISTMIKTKTTEMTVEFETQLNKLPLMATTVLDDIALTFDTKLDEIIIIVFDKSKIIGEQITAGVESGLSDLGKAMSKKFDEAIVEIMSDLEIHSPSRVAERLIGINFGLGVANGIEKTIPDNVSAMDKVADNLKLPDISPDLTLTDNLSKELDIVKEQWYNNLEDMDSYIITIIPIIDTSKFDTKAIDKLSDMDLDLGELSFEPIDFSMSDIVADINADMSNQSEYETDNTELIAETRRNTAAVEQLIAVMEDKDFNVEVNMDGRKIAESVTERQRRILTARGRG